MAEFTDKDRALMIKIAKQSDAFHKAFDMRLKALEVLKTTELETPLNMGSLFKHANARKTTEPIENGANTVEFLFKDKTGDAVKQRILAESVYKTLKELCDSQGVEMLKVHISNK